MTALTLFLFDRVEEPQLNPGEECPWPEYMGDAFSAMVVAAESEDAARKLAAKVCGDEGSRAWVDPRFTQATTLGAGTGEARVVVRGETPNVG